MSEPERDVDGSFDPFPRERFPWVDPGSPAADRWRRYFRAGDEEGLERFERRLAGPPEFCTSGWRAEMDVAERFDHVPPYSEAAENWRKLRERGDGAGMKRLEEWLEEAETAIEVRGIPFCRCGCGRVRTSVEFVRDPGELLARTFRLPDGTPVTEGPKDVFRIHREGEA